MPAPTTSVLIRTKNRPDRLSDAVLSVVKQSYRPIELIVINDGGVSVRANLEALLNGEDITWHYLEHSTSLGRSTAANALLQAATGDFLLFLDDDDWIAPEHIDQLSKALQEHPELIGMHSDTACVQRAHPDTFIRTFTEEFSHTRLAVENFLPIHSVLFKRTAAQQGCHFDSELSMYEDWHFWVQVANLGNLQRLPSISAYYSLDDSGVGGIENGNFTNERIKALKKIMPILSEEQQLHLNFSAIELLKCQNLLSERSIQRDQLSIEKDALKSNIYALEQHNKTLSENILKIEEKNRTLKEAIAEQNKQLRNIKLLIKMINTFKRAIRKAKTITRLLAKADFKGIKGRLQYNYHLLKDSTLSKPSIVQEVKALEAGINIIATQHTQYVAELVRHSLAQTYNHPIKIIAPDSLTFESKLHIVICPQMFSQLPDHYVAFQMEQSVSSRWFTDKYLSILNNAKAIMDYSIKNIEYLQSSHSIPYKKLFYTPISNINNYSKKQKTHNKDYDVVFYGDASTPRRKAFLDAIEKRYKLLIISEVFGDSLYKELSRAKIVLNIHYYEDALLETTRIHECLSLGLPIISERSSDQSEHKNLEPWITFTDIGDIAQMLAAIESQLKIIDSCIKSIEDIPDDLCHFHYYFSRMLVGLGVIDSSVIEAIPSPIAKGVLENTVGLTLPETYQRSNKFSDRYPNIHTFPGLRHPDGWKGCALSYKFLALQAQKMHLPYLEVWEDDALLDSAALEKWHTAKKYFIDNKSTEQLDALCGLIADFSEDTKVLDVLTVSDQKYAVIDRMVSMVCNIYGPKVIDSLAKWDANNSDIERNTIDRYLEKQTLRILVPFPFIAGHCPEQTSTLWQFNNSTYDNMILESQSRLERKIKAFEKETHHQAMKL